MANLQDRRRVLGPTDTVRLTYANEEPQDEEILSARMEMTDEDTTDRTRQRPHDEIRKLFLKQGLVSNSNGSCYVEVGDIQLQCTVNGPMPIRGSFQTQADLSVEAKYSPFDEQSHGMAGASMIEKSVASFIHTCITPSIMLDQYPKSAINILVTIISSSDNTQSLLSAAITAASVAIIDSGIAVRDIVTAGSVLIARDPSDGHKVYDDPERTRAESDIDAVVAYMVAKNNEITGISVEGGHVSPAEMDLIFKHSKYTAGNIRTLVNGLLLEDFRSKEQNLTTNTNK